MGSSDGSLSTELGSAGGDSGAIEAPATSDGEGTASADADATADAVLDGGGDATVGRSVGPAVEHATAWSAIAATTTKERVRVSDISWALTDGGCRLRLRRPCGTGCDGPYHQAMLLAVDIGNSNVTTGLFRNGVLAGSRRAGTDPRMTADELEHLLAGLLALDDATIADVSSIVAASVVPTVTAALETVAARRERPLVVASAGTIPLPIRTERPAEVGPDRLVNALAAARIHGTPAIVVDLGTATTFDCVAADGSFIGGAIAPGLELGLDALASRTAKLPRVALRAPDRALGRDTVGAIQSGSVLGYEALVEGLLGRLRSEVAEASGTAPGDVRVILTGGLSGAPWARAIESVDAIDPDLTLKGLAILHAEVGGGQPLELGLPG
jgi:type III pantothenate kinase